MKISHTQSNIFMEGLNMSNFKNFLLGCQDAMDKSAILTSYIQRFAYGIDASCYRYIPKLVLKPSNELEVQKIIKLAKAYCIPLTFRGSGTSLSGQACGDSVLVVCGSDWQEIKVGKESESIWLECGVIGANANETLKPFGKKIGPDPATINNASIGGIFSNNSSGMCCGTKQNSYQTIKSIRVILEDGSILDTSDSQNIQNFIQTHPQLIEQLQKLRKEINEDIELKNEITRKFSIKNTTGYSLNTFVDFTQIKDILNHIFVGAEGTLGFISRVEYHTVEDKAYKACALLFYENLPLISKAIELLSKYQEIVSAAEIMDYFCLKATQGIQGITQLKNIKEGNCALLIQLESNEKEEMHSYIQTITSLLENIPTLFPIHFSLDPDIQASWWKIRKAILPLAASRRRDGSTVITEDICFEIANFAKGIEEIGKLFDKFNFEGMIFGHALSGNVHFIICPILSLSEERERFGQFMEEMIEIVILLKGSTKAEHGTGRMIAPFVEKEWGEKAYKINRKIKKIFDPDHIFNPDVIISDDPQIHLKNLKPSNTICDDFNQCMECGFCERFCPSTNLTLTPRQRIVVFREIERLKGLDNPTQEEKQELEQLQRDYKYFGVQTCATCGMCAMACPLQISVGKVSIMCNHPSKMALSIAKKASQNISQTIKFARFGVASSNLISKVIGKKNLKSLSFAMNKRLKTPISPIFMPNVNTYKLQSKISGNVQKVIYFTSCLNRVFSPNEQARDRRSIQEVFESLCAKSKIDVIYPDGINKMCCGKAFRDFTPKDPSITPLQETLKILLNASNFGEIPIVLDHSACSAELIAQIQRPAKAQCLKVYDLSTFAQKFILPYLSITPINDPVGLHIICSTRKGGYMDDVLRIAKSCTTHQVYIDENTQCCGFAGNKGFFYPELNSMALQSLKKYFQNNPTNRLYSTSSTCEIGLSENTGKVWQHIIYLLDEVSK